MASLGKIKLSEVAPNHPFVHGAIQLGVPKPEISETEEFQSMGKKAPTTGYGEIAPQRTLQDVLDGQKQASIERDAEWVEARKKYPIRPTDPPEVQEEMRMAQNNMMHDP
jgi:hypothetical protein